MENNVIITSLQTDKQGVRLFLNKKTKLKTGNLSSDEFWVSWDKIGSLLLENYADHFETIKELREKQSHFNS